MTRYNGPAQHTYTPACDGFHVPGPCPPAPAGAVDVTLYPKSGTVTSGGDVAVEWATRPVPHQATMQVLRHFSYDRLPSHLQEISKPFADLAHLMAHTLDGPELTVGLRKLLEAKDCCVRAALDRED